MLVSRITSSDAMPTRSIFGRAHNPASLARKRADFLAENYKPNSSMILVIPA